MNARESRRRVIRQLCAVIRPRLTVATFNADGCVWRRGRTARVPLWTYPVRARSGGITRSGFTDRGRWIRSGFGGRVKPWSAYTVDELRDLLIEARAMARENLR